MYGKLFAQMYDGTLGTAGPWQALVAFQQLIILADKDGVVDMTAEAIARRTTIPLDIIQTGIKALEQPDPHSRTPDEEGRRIVKLSDERDWGWRIVNYAHYRNIRSQEERREYMRNYQRARRAAVNTDVNNVSNVNQSSMQYAVSRSIDTPNKTDTSARPRFVKPSIADVKAHCDERGSTVDPVAFVSFYESNGWKVGRNKMVDWKAAVITWEKKQRGSNGTHQQIDNSAVGKVRRANEERERRNAQRQANGPGMGTDGQNVRPPLDQQLRRRG
jgi:hypothetical protein